ncbi:MAG: DEAD/DEAH box helicase [Acidobacteriota bacterium]
MMLLHPSTQTWFRSTLGDPTPAQTKGWAAIARGDSTLIQAPTGSGKTLAAFLWAINRLMFDAVPPDPRRCRVLYVSPLKALAVDVEKNLRSPLAGIARQAALDGAAFHLPVLAVRSGDTPPAERTRFKRQPADILITTPESLYLLLTSGARDALVSVRTLIVDEVHALVATKRGAHLALSVERLEAIAGGPLQRIGLSATQRPLDEVARFLGGAEPCTPGHTPGPQTRPPARQRNAARRPRASALGDTPAGPERALHQEFQASGIPVRYRPVTIVDTGERKRLDLRVEVPVEDMARLGEPAPVPRRPAKRPSSHRSIWTAIHPRLLDLVRGHRSTLIFVNSRRVAERLAGAINELAGEPLVRAHHGSIAREQRVEIEDALKGGRLRGLVATSSLELGIDMGAIDLVVQIEAPPTVASGLQRAGRGGHHVHAISRAVLFPKFRGDLLSCAAVSRAMHDGLVESTRYPRNPLDVLAQQIVAMASMDRWHVDDLFAIVRRAAPFAELSRAIFEGVLDMLSGRYPSDEFAELKPRVTWDRIRGNVTAREGSRRVAVVSGGTIPDRGLYGVFLAGAPKGAARVGELDEEMVFESRVGETFVLGATTWRIEEISHDRVLVSPAPGEPGRMPFWKADAPGRPIEFGLRIGELVRRLREMPAPAAMAYLTASHDLDRQAAENLVRYVSDQAAAGAVPDDRTLVIERCRDELGEWRVCVLSPLGSRVHAPWAMAAAARIRAKLDLDVETMWTDDGFVVRFPDTDEPPDVSLLVPPSGDVEHLVVGEIGSTAFFAARFREAAGRALLLPRRRPGARVPLWRQRKRASDLLAVASRYGSFPIVLEAYRECLRDDFDIPALVDVLHRIEQRSMKLVTHDAETPSPFAASLLFGYVANYLYDGDAPLAERRAHALTIDQAQLRDLIGVADLRELLDAGVLDELERELQHLDGQRPVDSPDRLHDLLLRLGDLGKGELAARGVANPARLARRLVAEHRAIRATIAGSTRYVAVEHASQYRDALAVALPPGLPGSLLGAVERPLDELALRFARTHGPFSVRDFAARHGVAEPDAAATLVRLAVRGRLVEGSFRPGGVGREWCNPDVLRLARQRSVAKLRREAAPVAPEALGRLLLRWHGIHSGRSGPNTLLDAVEILQGAPLPASLLETSILPARVSGYEPGDLDALAAAGELAWVGLEPLGPRDGRLALYLTDHLPRLVRPRGPGGESFEGPLADRMAGILDVLREQGASFFAAIHARCGGGYPGETLDALWALVWKGLVTNDTFQALRRYVRPPDRTRHRRSDGGSFRSRRLAPPASEGRWALVPQARPDGTATSWAAAIADQLLSRHGVLTREAVAAESLAGGFGAIYPVLRAMEESGRIRRGYFVGGVAATQFARPAAVDLLRNLRSLPNEAEAVWLASTDPANPYGSVLKWPAAVPGDEVAAMPAFARAVGTSVVVVDGALAAFLRSGSPDVAVFLPEAEPDRSRTARALASELASIARSGEGRRGGLLVGTINGRPAGQHDLGRYLLEAGLVASAMGYYLPRTREPGSGAGDPL